MSKCSDKNVGSMEDDIKEIKESIEEAYRCYDYDLDYNPFSKGIAEIIERILADYARQKEINEEHQNINRELRQSINIVEKEKADWINAYQEEKDSQFELLKRIKKLEEELVMLKKASNIAKEVNIEDVTDVINESCKEFMSNYIPKQVVIDKIEELKEVRKIALERKMMSSVESFEIAIGHLEELLGGERNELER